MMLATLALTLSMAPPMLPVVSARKTTSGFGGIVGAVIPNGVAWSNDTDVTVGAVILSREYRMVPVSGSSAAVATFTSSTFVAPTASTENENTPVATGVSVSLPRWIEPWNATQTP